MKKLAVLDLDGVISNFVKGAFDLFGKSIPMADVRWDFWKQLAVTENEFWRDMGREFWRDMGREFWANLSFTDEGQELIARLEELYGENIIICTSPCLTDGCESGKVEWIRKNMPKYGRRYFVGSPKWGCASERSLLLDDSDENIRSFKDDGGKTITIPRPWNKRASECYKNGNFNVDNIIREVKCLHF